MNSGSDTKIDLFNNDYIWRKGDNVYFFEVLENLLG